MEWENVLVIDEDKTGEEDQSKKVSILSGQFINQMLYTIPQIWLNNIRDGAQSPQTEGGTSVAH